MALSPRKHPQCCSTRPKESCEDTALLDNVLSNTEVQQESQGNRCSIPLAFLVFLPEEDRLLWSTSRWRRSKMWRSRSPSSPQIHQKYIYMWNNSYRTPTECWQKTSVFPKGKKFPMYTGRAKEKRKNRDKRIGTGPAPVGGSCEGGKVSTH